MFLKFAKWYLYEVMDILISLIVVVFHEMYKYQIIKLHTFKILNSNFSIGASLVAQRLKRLPPMQETRVRSLGCKDTLEKEMAIHSSILAWRILQTEEPGRLQSMGSQRVGHDWAIISPKKPQKRLVNQDTYV